MKALIVDDEPMPAKHLEGLIQDFCFEIASTCIINSPTEALDHLKSYHYDLIFLDVEMPEIDGFELLEAANLPSSSQVIFTTAYSEYALEAFKANAAHYIVKSVTKEELVNAVRKASKLLWNHKTTAPGPTAENDVITVFDGDEHLVIKASEIIRLEADKGYTTIFLKNRRLKSSKGLVFFENRLAHSGFFRCHHSHLINLSEIVKIGKGKNTYVVLANEDVIPISYSKRDEFNLRMRL